MNKMKGLYVLFCTFSLWLSFQPSTAQEHHLSVQTLAKDHEVSGSFTKDTTYITGLINKAVAMQLENVDSAMFLFKIAATRSISASYYDGAGEALLYLGAAAFTYKNNAEMARAYQRQAMSFVNHATVYKGRLLAKYYSDLAHPYQLKGLFDSVAIYSHMAIDALTKYNEGSPRLLVPLYNNLSAAYHETGQYTKSLDYQKRAAAILESQEDREGLILIYSNIAGTYLALQDTAHSRLYSNMGLGLCKVYPKSRYLTCMSGLYSTLGALSLTANKPYEAISYFESAITTNRKYYSYLGAADQYRGLSAAYKQLKDYKKEEYYLLEAMKAANKIERADNMLVDIYTDLSEVYSNLQQYEKAYYYRDIAAELKGKLITKDKILVTNKLDALYQTAEKDKDIIQKQLLLSHRNSELQSKNYWITGISVASFFLTILLAGLYRNYRQKQKTQIEKMNSLQKEKEISNLKAVITGEERERTRLARDLHDGNMVLFSAVKMQLRGLPKYHRELAGNSNFEEISTQLDLAIKELRRTAHNLMPDMLLEGGLAEAVFYFCSTLQQSTNIRFLFQQYGEMPRLQEEFELSLYRIVQELLQNIIKHAHASKGIVQLNYSDAILCITVEDNGQGFTDTNLENHSGMGLKSIRTRVSALNGSIDIRSITGKGTTVYLEFDIRSVIKSQSSEHAY